MEFIGSGAIERRRKKVYVGYNKDGKRIPLELTAPQLNCGMKSVEQLPTPPAPQGKVLRDARGKQITNELTGVPQREVLTNSPEHRELIRRNQIYRNVAMLYWCIVPGQINWVAKEENFESKRDFWIAIEEEMRKGGITTSVFDMMVKAAEELAVVDQKEYEEADEAIEVTDSKGNDEGLSPTGS